MNRSLLSSQGIVITTLAQSNRFVNTFGYFYLLENRKKTSPNDCEGIEYHYQIGSDNASTYSWFKKHK